MDVVREPTVGDGANSRADLDVRFRWQDLGWGPLIWISTHVAVVIAVLTMEAFDVPYRGNIETQLASSPERTALIAFSIAAVIFAPIFEEACCSAASCCAACCPRRIRQMAIVLQGVLFGAAHIQPDFGRENIGLVIALSVAGIGFGLGCYLLRRLGSGDDRSRLLQRRGIVIGAARRRCIERWPCRCD